MPSARMAAIYTLQDVVDKGQSLSTALESRLPDIPEREHGFFQALSYQSVRWLFLLESILRQLLSKPLKRKEREVHFLLVSALCQLQFMAKPSHAVVNETVNLTQELDKPWARKLVNGVLRSFLRQQEELVARAQQDPGSRYSVPDWLLAKLQAAYPDQWARILEQSNRQAPMTLRVNRLRLDRLLMQQRLEAAGVSASPCELAPSGLTLASPVSVDKLPGFFTEQTCSVQDEAAQLASTLLQCKPGEQVLDACSAPGGKTAALLESYPGIRLLAVDESEERQQRTRETLDRLELEADVEVADIRKLTAWATNRQFDRILLDAPCSATGVIRRHPDIKILRRDSDIHQLAKLQWEILQQCWQQLRPGGQLLYATCSILPQENSKMIARFLRETQNAIEQAIPLKGDTPTPHGCQLLPKSDGHDGFFYALLKKAPST